MSRGQRETALGGEVINSLLASVDKDSIGLTLCEVGVGVRLATPAVDGVATMLVLLGVMYLDVKGEPTRRVRAGELILLPSGTSAQMRSNEMGVARVLDGASCLTRRNGTLVADATMGGERQLLVAAARVAGSTSVRLAESIVIPLFKDRQARLMMTSLRNEVEHSELGSAAFLEALMNACLVLGLRFAADGEQSLVSGPCNHGRGVERAIAAIKARPADPHSISTLAAIAGLSRATFTRQFARATQMTPGAYLLQERLTEAAATLRSSRLPVKTVAAYAGFASRSHFTRSFRMRFGVEPTAYRSASSA